MSLYDPNHQSPDEIAAALDRDRAALAASLGALRARVTGAAVLDLALDVAKARIGPATRAVDRAVCANPTAALMVGAGLAWLVLGGKRHARCDSLESTLAGTKFEALSRWEDEGGPVTDLPVSDLAAADLAWLTEADTLRDRATRALDRIEVAARAGLRPVADVARARAEVLADLARDTRHAMMLGLENLSSGTQQRLLAVREEAYAMRGAAARKTARLIEDRPVAAGILASAIGAALAAALPRTQTEDRLLGAERDRLMSKAQQMLSAERVRAAAAAAALASSGAGEAAQGARRSVVGAL